MSGALLRYRVLANLVGVALLVLVLVAIPLRYLGGQPALSKVVSPVHGTLFLLYLGVTYDLSRRVRWPLGRTLLIMLAGTVPFMSFVLERRTTRELQRQADVPLASRR